MLAWAKWNTGPIWCCNSLSLGQVELEGLTGHIEFNSKGQRSNYALKILQYTRNGFRQVSLAILPWWQTSSLFFSLSSAHFSLTLRIASFSQLCPRTTSCILCKPTGMHWLPPFLTRISQCGSGTAALAKYQEGGNHALLRGERRQVSVT